MKGIRLGVIGVGNCTSSLVQGRYYYRDLKVKPGEVIPGLMHPEIGGYRVSDIEPVVAFDVDARKVGKDLSEAIWSKPNCTEKFSDVPKLGVKVLMGPVLDGVSEHLKERYVEVSSAKPIDDVDTVAGILKENKVDVIVNNLPTASEKASWFYAAAAMKAGCGIVNGITVLIANNAEFAKKAEVNGVPIVGDDYKSQLGGTILDRALLGLCLQRGIKISRS